VTEKFIWTKKGMGQSEYSVPCLFIDDSRKSAQRVSAIYRL